MGATQDGLSWWLKLNTPPRNFLPILMLSPFFGPSFLPLSSLSHAPETGEVGNKWETRWQDGAKWIWVMGSWVMCLFNHLVATPSVLWWSACGGKESSPEMNACIHCWFDRVKWEDSSWPERSTPDELVFKSTECLIPKEFNHYLYLQFLRMKLTRS